MRQGSSDQAQPEETARLLLSSLESERRRPRRAIHLHLHGRPGGSRADQQLDGAEGDVSRSCAAMPPAAMRGRTMYVVPYLMGPPGSPLAKVGIELTDSIYVVLSMGIMTRMGEVAYEQLGDERRFQPRPALHVGRESGAPLHRAFPAGQRDHLRRLELRRQRAAGQEVPRAAHRLLSRPAGRLVGRAHADPGASNRPTGEKTYVAAAFPSACGKTNFAMMIPAAAFQGLENLDHRRRHRLDEARARTAGSTPSIPRRAISASCPAPIPSPIPNAVEMISHDTIFTNVALTPDLRCLVGRQRRPAAQGMPRLEGQQMDARLEGKGGASQQPLHRADDQQPGAGAGGQRSARACRSARSSSAAGAATRCRWSTRRSTGFTASTSARRWARR